MTEETEYCEECGSELFKLDDEWHCAECEDISSFELPNGQSDFKV